MVEIYSPNATWSRVKAAVQGAKVVIYLGHGNGSPSPYGPWNKYTKDGFGLNAIAGHGNSNRKYYGEYYIDTQLHLARNAVVILNRLCYASGNSEWGSPNPTKTAAKTRVDNFASGFLRANARAVFAEGITSASYILYGLFKTNRSIGSIFQSSSHWDTTVRLPVPVAAQPGIPRLDGSLVSRSLLPVGRRQPRPDRGHVPRRADPPSSACPRVTRRPRSGSSIPPGPLFAW